VLQILPRDVFECPSRPDVDPIVDRPKVTISPRLKPPPPLIGQYELKDRCVARKLRDQAVEFRPTRKRRDAAECSLEPAADICHVDRQGLQVALDEPSASQSDAPEFTFNNGDLLVRD
jgi:hypothetical protein